MEDLSENEIGYRIYLWDRSGYGFTTVPYNPAYDYTPYLSYYVEEKKNQDLIKSVLEHKI